MHSFQKYLPEHWNEWIRLYAIGKTAGRYDSLGANDFQQMIKIQFIDDSSAVFNGALAVEDKERGETAIFTEHCGYHIFTFSGIESLLDHNNEKLEPVSIRQYR